jgi:hypothetical protein
MVLGERVENDICSIGSIVSKDYITTPDRIALPWYTEIYISRYSEIKTSIKHLKRRDRFRYSSGNVLVNASTTARGRIRNIKIELYIGEHR